MQSADQHTQWKTWREILSGSLRAAHIRSDKHRAVPQWYETPWSGGHCSNRGGKWCYRDLEVGEREKKGRRRKGIWWRKMGSVVMTLVSGEEKKSTRWYKNAPVITKGKGSSKSIRNVSFEVSNRILWASRWKRCGGNGSPRTLSPLARHAEWPLRHWPHTQSAKGIETPLEPR